MYCRNCGHSVEEKAVVCVSCGAAPENGKKFCQNCGAPTDVNAEICTKCGVRVSPGNSAQAGPGRDWTVALILSVLAGQFGVDRFYTGYIGLGILKLLTGGGCGIWWLIDVILIATGKYRDSEGNLLVRK